MEGGDSQVRIPNEQGRLDTLGLKAPKPSRETT